MQTIESVSYTHLDVYKRQHYTTLKAYNKGVENPEDKLYLHEQVELGLSLIHI